VDFDASARAMHQSALKGSLMVHETAFSTPAASRKSLGATMFERNTMLKTLKRKVALVAVSVLGASGLAVVAAPVANGVVATITPTITPIRVTYSGTNTTADAVPKAEIKITTTAVLTDANTRGTLTILSAPKPGAVLSVGDETGTELDSSLTNNGAAGAGDVLLGNTTASTEFSIPIWFQNDAAGTAPIAGTYAFSLVLEDSTAGNYDLLTINGSFTTTGAPTSLTVTPTATSLLVSGVDTATATLKDGSGKQTQPLTVDGLTLTTTAGTFTDGTNTAVTADELNEGTIDLTYTAANAAGSATATVTPTGTLPFFGSTAQSITYNYTGSIDVVALTALSISAPVVPTTAITGTLAAGDRAAIVPQGTSAVTISATGTASSKIRLRVVVSAGTVNGSAASAAAPQYFNVDTAATTGAATLALTLGGAALASTATLTVAQVDVLRCCG